MIAIIFGGVRHPYSELCTSCINKFLPGDTGLLRKEKKKIPKSEKTPGEKRRGRGGKGEGGEGESTKRVREGEG